MNIFILMSSNLIVIKSQDRFSLALVEKKQENQKQNGDRKNAENSRKEARNFHLFLQKSHLQY